MGKGVGEGVWVPLADLQLSSKLGCSLLSWIVSILDCIIVLQALYPNSSHTAKETSEKKRKGYNERRPRDWVAPHPTNSPVTINQCLFGETQDSTFVSLHWHHSPLGLLSWFPFFFFSLVSLVLSIYLSHSCPDDDICKVISKYWLLNMISPMHCTDSPCLNL